MATLSFTRRRCAVAILLVALAVLPAISAETKLPVKQPAPPGTTKAPTVVTKAPGPTPAVLTKAPAPTTTKRPAVPSKPPVQTQAPVATKVPGATELRCNDYSEVAYSGGRVMVGRVTVYIIYYGDWSDPQSKKVKDAVEYLIKNLGVTDWWKINTKYYMRTNTTRQHVGTDLVLGGTINLPNTTSYVDTWTDMEGILTQVTKSAFKQDINAVYLFMPALGISVSKGSRSKDYLCGGGYCAWHAQVVLANGVPLHYAAVPGWMDATCITGCKKYFKTANDSDAPNGVVIDSIASFVAHEIQEATTNPGADGWMGPGGRGDEGADRCNNEFPGVVNGKRADGSTVTYNLVVGDRKYLIQGNWNIECDPKRPGKQKGCAVKL